ncbi:MAG TPA: TonB-dependent receptor [Bacteroidia bacterium]
MKLSAQTEEPIDSNTFRQQTVTSYRNGKVNETSLNLLKINRDSLKFNNGFTLSESLATLPGVSMLSTGIGINKPVIRGLYGNRILILLAGLKFDNQQWQEEHGLGLSENGLSSIELIKGPMGVLYGSEAIGGVINLIEESKPSAGTRQMDVSGKLNSNTLGGNFSFGYKMNTGKHWIRLRLSMDDHADYSNGKNERVLNSRFNGITLKSTYGFKRNQWQSDNHFTSSFNRFGFIFNDVYTFISPDKRWSRSLAVNPAHLVLLNMLSSQNQIQLKGKSRLNVNAGLQSNRRMENEGGGAISLDMHLLTLQYLLKYEKELSQQHSLILSHLGLYENNTNYGARKIVPDAVMTEFNVSAYLESKFRRLKNKKTWLTTELGAGAGRKQVNTLFTAGVNDPNKEISPFRKIAYYENGFAGISISRIKNINIKLNASTGVRIPNLAELSSDGLHEGVFTYEIGDPKLKNETLSSLNAVFDYNQKNFSFSWSPFYNHFNNYVYLAPTIGKWLGFPVFRYMQQNAVQMGMELTMDIRFLKRFRLSALASGMNSKTASGEYTPYTPANKIGGTLSYDYKFRNGATIGPHVKVDHYDAQRQLAPNEIGTASYELIGAGVSGTFFWSGKILEWSLVGNNLGNKAYYDHLSRFKYFGLLNPGRNIFASVKYTFNSKTN